MEFKDYYATLGVAAAATQAEVKRAYRKLARQFHPDVSKEPDAEARFKAVAEAHEALIDPERRAAYDHIAQRHANGQAFEPPPGWDTGFEYSGRGEQDMPGAPRHGADGEADFSDFFESLFGRGGPGGRAGAGGPRRSATRGPTPGADHHAKLAIDLMDACRGALRSFTLRMPVTGSDGHTTLQQRQLEVRIPAGVRHGQHLRLAGQGGGGQGGGAAGDLFLGIEILPHPVYRLDGADLTLDLPVAPWEAALGAVVTTPTPGGPVQLTLPPGTAPGRKLRLKGRGLPGKQRGDLYAVVRISLPPAAAVADQAAYTAFAQAFATYNPRAALEATDHG